MQTSSRRGISHPSLDRSDRPDVPAHIKNLVDALELDPSINVSSAASRPANPGYPRYFHWATDTHILSFWDGTAWNQVGSVDLIPQSTIDAKGDLVVGLSDNVSGRLPIGANGYELQADNTQPQGMKWAIDPVLDLAQAKGDLFLGTGTDAIGRLGPGVNGQSLIADSTQTVGAKWGTAPIPYIAAKLSSDFALTAANTKYEPPQLNVTLTAGKWHVTATLTITRGSAGVYVAGIWDTVSNWIAITEAVNAGGSGAADQIHLEGIADISSTTTFAVAIGATTTGNVVKAASPSVAAVFPTVTTPPGNWASQVIAIQLA